MIFSRFFGLFLNIRYWDSSLDSQSPTTSKIYKFFGGNGDQNGCIPNGAFQNLQSSVPTNHCVARNFDTSVALYPVELVSLLTSSVSGEKTYNSFRENLEGTIHNSVHSFISGDMVISYISYISYIMIIISNAFL